MKVVIFIYPLILLLLTQDSKQSNYEDNVKIQQPEHKKAKIE